MAQEQKSLLFELKCGKELKRKNTVLHRIHDKRVSRLRRLSLPVSYRGSLWSRGFGFCLRLTVTMLPFLRLTAKFIPLRLTKIKTTNFNCFKKGKH